MVGDTPSSAFFMEDDKPAKMIVEELEKGEPLSTRWKDVSRPKMKGKKRWILLADGKGNWGE